MSQLRAAYRYAAQVGDEKGVVRFVLHHVDQFYQLVLREFRFGYYHVVDVCSFYVTAYLFYPRVYFEAIYLPGLIVYESRYLIAEVGLVNYGGVGAAGGRARADDEQFAAHKPCGI